MLGYEPIRNKRNGDDKQEDYQKSIIKWVLKKKRSFLSQIEVIWHLASNGIYKLVLDFCFIYPHEVYRTRYMRLFIINIVHQAQWESWKGRPVSLALAPKRKGNQNNKRAHKKVPKDYSPLCCVNKFTCSTNLASRSTWILNLNFDKKLWTRFSIIIASIIKRST